jgi:hypothetical protein
VSRRPCNAVSAATGADTACVMRQNVALVDVLVRTKEIARKVAAGGVGTFAGRQRQEQT